jgi:AraC-like DNA-binding protein
MHSAPDSLTAYQRAFANAKLTFDASCYGFRIPAALVDAPFASREPMLHVLQREHLEQRHAALCGHPNAALRVREFLVTEMRQRRPNAEAVAQRMRVSRRTLVRQLEREHTSFSEQLDKLRQELAVHLVAAPELPLREIAGRLGFSHVQAFHRAFKRWTGQTPIQYRFAAAKQRYVPADNELELAADGGSALPGR